MLEYLKKESTVTYTENGALAYSTTGNECLDLFFRAGAMRFADEREIADVVIRAYVENPEKAMKIIFFVRDIRGGLGERRFFRTAIKTLLGFAPEAVERNIPYFSEYGRFDDLLAVMDSQCERVAFEVIKGQIETDIKAMRENKEDSLIEMWLK